MNPLLIAGGIAQAVPAISNLIGGGKARRAAKKNRKEELRLLRENLAAFDEESPRRQVALGESQQGLEGGLAKRREDIQKIALARQRDRIMSAIKQAKRAKSAAGRTERLSVLGDIAGIGTNVASGLSELFAKPEMPIGEQLGAEYGAGIGGMGGPFGMLQGALGGQQFARRRAALQGLLGGGY
jgi:hypothetical protein